MSTGLWGIPTAAEAEAAAAKKAAAKKKAK